MRELLLAYLFGQLELHEREQVERALAERPQLQEELRRLQACLHADEKGDASSCNPPSDLVRRTCEQIAKLVRDQNLRAPGDAGWRGISSLSQAGSAPGLSDVAGPFDRASRNGCSVGELAAAVGVSILMAMLIVPAIQNSRASARRQSCQDHLRQITQGIFAFGEANEGVIPLVPADGRDAFAGIFPVFLADGQFIDRQTLGELLTCPGTIHVGEWRQDAYLIRMFIPTHEQVMSAPEETLATWRRRLAGSYAYRFGYVDKAGRYRPWRLDYSSRSAILSDAPGSTLAEYQSSNHGGHGQNVGFADGHVEFLVNCASAGHDHLFLNCDGKRAAPKDTMDTVLGRSEDSPGVMPQEQSRY